MNYQFAVTSTTEKEVTTSTMEGTTHTTPTVRTSTVTISSTSGSPILTGSTTITTRCEEENIMTNEMRVPGSSVSVEPTMPDDDIANLLNPNNDKPVTLPGTKAAITIVVDGTITAIEIRGENIKIESIYYTDSTSGELTEVVSITSFTNTFK